MDIKEDKLVEYLERRGRRASEELTRLGRLDANIRVNLQSEVGREILSEDIKRLDELWIKLYDGATDREVVEFKYLEERINRLSKRLTLYREGVSKLEHELNTKGA